MTASLAAAPIVDAATGQPVLYPCYVTEFDGMLYFRGGLRADGPVTGLWRSDGVTAERIAGIGPGGLAKDPTYLTVHDEKLYFCATATPTGGSRLWQYDPYAGVSLAPGSSTNASLPEELTSYNGNLYFRATRFGSPSNIGTELWKFDGTNQTPMDIFAGKGSSYPQHLIEFGGQLYFNACGESGQGTELWRTNGTALAAMPKIYPNNGSSPENIAIYDDRLYFSAYDGVHGFELWSYDPGENTVSLKADIQPGGQYSSSNPGGLCEYNGRLYFSANDGVHGSELWSYEASTGVAQMVAEINPTPDPGNGDTFEMDSMPGNLTVFNGLLYFSADDGVHGPELWSYDGSSVTMVADINPGRYGSGPSEFLIFNDQLYFSADDGFNPAFGSMQPTAFALSAVQLNHWSGSLSGDWGTAANWSARGVPDGQGVQVVLGEDTPQTTINLGTDNRVVGNLIVTSDKSMTIESTSGKALVLDNGPVEAAITAAGSHAITAPVMLKSETRVTLPGSLDLLTLSGNVSGEKLLVKDGSGKLVLSGENHHAGTIVEEGMLEVASADALPAGGSLTIGAGGTVVLDGGLTVAGGAVTAVPEPGSVALLVAAVGIGLVLRARYGRHGGKRSD